MKIYKSFIPLFVVFVFCFLYLNLKASNIIPLNKHVFCNLFKKEFIKKFPADTNSLKKALLDFIAKTDSDKYDEIILIYDSDFVSIRVVDAGQFIKMDYAQMVYFWKMQAGKQPMANTFNHKNISAGNTTIHYIEVLGDTGYVILTRVKDFGNGPEPVFYNLIWVNKNNKWYLLREIVHQRTMPSFH